MTRKVSSARNGRGINAESEEHDTNRALPADSVSKIQLSLGHEHKPDGAGGQTPTERARVFYHSRAVASSVQGRAAMTSAR